MSKVSAGILVYRKDKGKIEVLLLRMGGPFFANKDSWTIPKGEAEPGEEELSAAKREFQEEVGLPTPEGALIDLGPIKQSAAKTNHIWAIEGDVDISKFVCNEFEMEWPPKSGKLQRFMECDQAEWFDLDSAKRKIRDTQVGFLNALEEKLGNI